MKDADVTIIGGGFFGCCLALSLKDHADRVWIIEKEKDILQRASAINQARVHAGFHYPRNLITAYRSIINFPRFILDFRKAIVGDFVKLYAIARIGSKTNAPGFYKMYRKMGAKIKRAAAGYRSMFDHTMIEDVFEVDEKAFNVDILREQLREKLDSGGIRVLYETEVEKVSRSGDRIEVILSGDAEPLLSGRVFNCTYSQINKVLHASGEPLLPLKHELTELALLEMPPELRNVAVTVMDGPFFSIMPYPPAGLHSLSHVRYTPHDKWQDTQDDCDPHAHMAKFELKSHFPYMIRDAGRYLKFREHTYAGSLYEIKSVLIQNEVDDGRPILYKHHERLGKFYSIMGGKIDNIYDIIEIISESKKTQ